MLSLYEEWREANCGFFSLPEYLWIELGLMLIKLIEQKEKPLSSPNLSIIYDGGKNL